MTALTSAQLESLRSLHFRQIKAAAQQLCALPDHVEWLELISQANCPQDALNQWSRLVEGHPDLISRWQEHFGEKYAQVLQRVNAVFGHSRALGDYLLADCTRFREEWLLFEVQAASPEHLREWIYQQFDAVMTDQQESCSAGAAIDRLRRGYRQCLLGIVGSDLSSPQPTEIVDSVFVAMSCLVDIALERALALAKVYHPEAKDARLAIIAMGKTGACELNYISDVDVMYVCAEDDPGREAATVLATEIASILSSVHPDTEEEPLWMLDTALRPEGKDGALVRSISSFCRYWEKWAQTWEFQALLKSRFCAGDVLLGQEFEEAASPYIWSAAGRSGFVADARAMRRRVEGTISSRDADRELKLGKGGLRDVEFSVQMLQLVHGRTDEILRLRPTLEALQALCDGGYVSRSDSQHLDASYRFLRALEHRVQLLRMRRTHLLPQQESSLRTVARSMGCDSPQRLMDELRRIRGQVRSLHQEMFYRPIVEATAGLSSESMSLAHDLHTGNGRMDEDAVRDRLAAIGFVDTRGAYGHIQALCQGTSRRASIQRHLLPVFLGWLSDSVDPDAGLLHFRTLSDCIGESHWYLRLLRDSQTAAERLVRALARSRWLAQSLELRPEAVQWLDDDRELQPRSIERLQREMTALLERHSSPEEAALRIRAVRTRELTRCALADVTFGVNAENHSISEVTDCALDAALTIALREDEATHGALVDVAFFAMGRYGGSESGFASDADIIVVHRGLEGVDDRLAAQAATRVTHRVQQLLGTTASHAGVTVDIDLRPEGKNGPVSRTVAAYEEYYTRWASTWEKQALLRARPAAGCAELAQELLEIINSVRHSPSPTPEQIQEIRLLKARMERERLPRGVVPQRHVKLGPGGLSDVEWVVQLLQLRYAWDYPQLRTSQTLEALEAACAIGLLSSFQAQTLSRAWKLASQIRSANVLVSGRMSGQKLDLLPISGRDFIPVARLLNYEQGAEMQLEEDWLRSARLARQVMDDIFWA